MLVELRGRGARRDRFLFTFQGTVLTLIIFIILMTTVSCSCDECEPLFSLPVIDAANQQSVQRDEGQPEVRREQPKTSTSPKVAAVPAPKAKKANTPPRLAAQKEQQLYQEFLEWRKRQLFYEYTP
jgi:hypothetical protein